MVAARLRAALDVLEELVVDREPLGLLSDEERRRLVNAAGDVFSPDVEQRRQRIKARRRQEKADRRRREAEVLDATGIRSPAGPTGVHHAQRVRPRRRRTDRGGRRGRSPGRRWRPPRRAALLRLQAPLRRGPPLLRPALPVLRRAQLRQAHRDRRPLGAGRPAHRRSGEDRLPGRHQAAPRRRLAHRHHPVPAGRGGPLRRRAGCGGVVGPPRGLRPRPAPHAERGGAVPPPARHPRPPRLHRQQRLPDRAPTPGVLRPHAGGGDRGAGPPWRPRSGPAARATTTACAGRPIDDGPAALAATAGELDAAARAALLSQARLLPEDRGTHGHLFPAGHLDADRQQVDQRRPELVAPHARRGVHRRAARDPAGQRGRAVRAERPAQAADAADPRAGQAHRERLGGGGPVLPSLQDHPAPAHQHGQGRAQHDDPHVGGGLPRRRHPHEQRRHRLGHRRGPRRPSPTRSGPSTASTRRSTSSTARPASSTRSSTASTPATTCGASS